jgi:hypothetical protein
LLLVVVVGGLAVGVPLEQRVPVAVVVVVVVGNRRFLTP